ncbi:metallophosphoesterase [Gemmata sp.]|uniref:metallophosphoesterase n=1 Tax=Gemmata sp. TaxID=1914242 RepID=UPI003F6F4973
MKHFAVGLATAAALAGVIALSRSESAPNRGAPQATGDLVIEAGEKNPWTSLKLNSDADQFQFAVVSDRTGGHREKVFSRAVAQVNLLQPQFVMSVGDLIEGYTLKEEVATEQWDEFDGYVKRFEMPFFYVPGNHDLANKVLATKWGERYGKRYYHFTYKNVLFLALNSETPPDEMGTIDKEQQAWLAKVTEANKGARWTFVFVHKPLWVAADLDKNGWAAVETALAGRNHTVFCGHVHRYQVFDRNGAKYYQLATTGGGSRMRGVEYGEFDHVAWVTVKKDKPLVANVLLEGILPADLKVPESDEKGKPVKKEPTFPVSGTLKLDGEPVARATVALARYNAESKKYTNIADGRTDDLGRFQVTTYARFDGAPAGEYVVTATRPQKPADKTAPKNVLPERYATAALTPLRASIKDGTNDLSLDLTTK